MMKDKILSFLKQNILVFIGIIIAFIIEVSTLYNLGFSTIIKHSGYFLVILGFVSCILFLLPLKAKTIIMPIFLLLHGAINVLCVYLYDSNGTFFEWSMVNQRNDAFGTIEDFSLRWDLVALVLGVLIIFTLGIVFLWKYYYKKNNLKLIANRLTKFLIVLLVLFCGAMMVSIPTINAYSHKDDDYVEKFLYGFDENKYEEKGITANLVYEFFNGNVANALVRHEIEGNEVDDFLYGKDCLLDNSDYFGISKDNNLIYILVESFEWYPFLYNCTKEQSLELYPNLNRLLNEGIYADNFYAREKTDTAEMLALVGSNPTDKYINYDFPENSFPFALPNMFRDFLIQNNKQIKHIKSFHQNIGDFYNRNILHQSLGFDDLVDINDMAAFGIVNHWDEDAFEGERTPDSETVLKMQNEMFPQTNDNEQYMTFWITFAMHGYYKERETFKDLGYYDELDRVGAYPESDDEKANYLRTYAAAVMDFDRAVGIMLNKLEENHQLDKTTIVMFADHNTYYNNLSKYAKDIEEYDSELYRLPFIIYDEKLRKAYYEKEKTNVISKFTTTSDILPTILDIMGIKGYKNLYLGSSVFLKNIESVIFSRAYGMFITDKLICYSPTSFLYQKEGFTENDLNDFINRATILLTKLEYLDLIYYNDYFKNNLYRRI